MDSVDRDAEAQPVSSRAAKKPWMEPKVILSDPISSGVRVDNKGLTTQADVKLSSTSTS